MLFLHLLDEDDSVSYYRIYYGSKNKSEEENKIIYEKILEDVTILSKFCDSFYSCDIPNFVPKDKIDEFYEEFVSKDKIDIQILNLCKEVLYSHNYVKRIIIQQ